MVPSTIVMPRDGSFALALLGSLRRVHEPILNSVASKRIVDIFPCSLSASGIAAIFARTALSPSAWPARAAARGRLLLVGALPQCAHILL